MQYVDYWLGRPLCFIATILDRFLHALIRNSADPSHTERAIFIELSEMGAAIVAAPAIRKAVTSIGKENVYFMIFRRNRESVEIQDIIETQNIIVIEDSSFSKFLISTVSAIIKMRRIGISTAFDLELFSRCTALLSWISGARDRIGFGSGPDEGPYRGHLFSREVRYNHHLHMSHNFMALVNAQLQDNKTPYIKLPAGNLPKLDEHYVELKDTEIIMQSLFDLIRHTSVDAPIILLNPDAGSLSLRGWPIENWGELANRIENEFPGYNTLVVGLPQFYESAEKILASTSRKRTFNFCGKTKNLAELTALMSRASVLITCDSGPAHFASLVNLPTIALFGPETPALYRPLGDHVHVIFQSLSCSPCYSAYNHRQSSCTENICMKSISVQQVVDKMRLIMPSQA